MNKTVTTLIDAYRLFISPLLGGHCRFYPSCSDYAREAFARYDFSRALRLTTNRLLRCGPWNEGGVDMVHGENKFEYLNSKSETNFNDQKTNDQNKSLCFEFRASNFEL